MLMYSDDIVQAGEDVITTYLLKEGDRDPEPLVTFDLPLLLYPLACLKMSHSVLRGTPAQSQLYLDGVLDSIIQDGATRASTRDGVNLAEVLFYCMRTHPEGIHSINAETGEKFSNKRILKRSVSIARALTTICAKERVIIMLRNHEHMSAVYYAVLFAGVIPFMMEPESTIYEIQQFLPLISPRLVICEPDRHDDVIEAIRGCNVKADVLAADGPSLDKFVKGFSDDIDSYHLPDVSPDSPAIILPTSGSTGLPKAALISHEGLVVQIPAPWLYHSQFPLPTRLAFLWSTGQWISHTNLMVTCTVYQVPLLMTPANLTMEHVVQLAEKYRPTIAMFGSGQAASIGHLATKEQLSSFDRICVAGAAFSPETLATLQEKLAEPTRLINIYGLTEALGLVAAGPRGTPLLSVGKVVNFLDYRIVNENGEDVSKPYEKGEMLLKGKSIFKIYPEEIERVIESIPGVKEAVVCGAEGGATAIVILQPGCDVSRETIHQAVNSTLSDYKRLRGGIAFVTSLPRTHSRKVARAQCLQLIQEMAAKGECF